MRYYTADLPHAILAVQQQALETCTAEQIADEGFFSSLLDFFGRITNNLRTYLLKAFKNFKRSELEAYLQSHAFSTRTFFRQKTVDFQQVRVPVPDGLKSTYPAACFAVQQWSKAAQIDQVLAQAVAYFRQYEKLSLDGYSSLREETRQLTKTLNKVNKATIEKTLRQHFDTRHIRETKPAGEVIGTRQELLEVHEQVLAFAADYRLAQKAIGQVEMIEKSVAALVAELQKASRVDPSYLRALHGLVTVLAEQIDMFGVLLDYEQRIEHYYVLSLVRIVAETR